MRLSISEALEVLNVKGLINQKTIKQTYRKLAHQYHPDKNPDGLQTMQKINVAYDYLSKISDVLLQAYNVEKEQPYHSKKDYYDDDIFNMVAARGLYIYEDDKKYIWVEGKTYHHREFLKEHGFRWNPDKKAWWRYK